MRLYTIGYVGAGCWRCGAALDALPVDVRLVPLVRDKQWARGSLSRRFDARRLHLCAFGNVSYRRDGAPVQLDSDGRVLASQVPWPPLSAKAGRPKVDRRE